MTKADFILVAKTDTWHDRQVLLEAKKRGASVRKVDFVDWSEFLRIKWDAPVVLWRSSSSGAGEKRARALKELQKKGKIIINQGVVCQPEITHKDFQQKKVAAFLKEINSIPTFLFKNKKELLVAVNNKKLIFPFIKKPDLGAQGEGVVLIKRLSEVSKLKDDEIQGCVFQNFIENDGDYRVLVLGGCPLGVIKRIAKEGGFLNNISQGGTAVAIYDEKIVTELSVIAAKIAATFDLGFCGVDLILNKKTGQFHFLELNTVPQWQGFQRSTKVNVVEKIVIHCQKMADRGQNEAEKLIQDFYETAPILSEEKKFHFYSRLYLWTGDKKYKKALVSLQDYFLGGKNKQAWRKKIEEILSSEKIYQRKVANGKSFRKELVKNYPLLGVYHELLFRSLLAKNIFGIDWWKIVLEVVPKEKLLVLAKTFLKNREDLQKLSTFAVNYLFLLDFFLPEIVLREKIEKTFSPIIEGINSKEKSFDELKNNLYFLTHCVVAGSKFYSQKSSVKSDFFEKIGSKLEDILKKNYSKISLDNKLEFLVCERLIGRKSSLESRIFSETTGSLSPIGNFLIDSLNENKKDFGKRDFFSSEHRNVLYLMVKNTFGK